MHLAIGLYWYCIHNPLSIHIHACVYGVAIYIYLAGAGSLPSTGLLNNAISATPGTGTITLNPPVLVTKLTPALVTSPAFPPVPGKLVDKIQAGQFVELKELLMDNAALLRQTASSAPINTCPAAGTHNLPNRQLREIQDPLSCVFCYFYFLAAASSDPLARELAAYGQIIIHLAQKHGGKGWLSYDRLFRLQRAASSEFPWTEINTSLMASTVLTGPGQSCSLCAGSDHSADTCALAVWLLSSSSLQVLPQVL
jgi:hypothetical protein